MILSGCRCGRSASCCGLRAMRQNACVCVCWNWNRAGLGGRVVLQTAACSLQLEGKCTLDCAVDCKQFHIDTHTHTHSHTQAHALKQARTVSRNQTIPLLSSPCTIQTLSSPHTTTARNTRCCCDHYRLSLNFLPE